MGASWPIPPDLKVVSVNDYPLTYAEEGSGTPVILVHGSVLDYRAWKGVMVPLGERYHVIAPNLRHYYPEPWKGEGGNFSAEQHADDLAALVKVLNFGKAHWVGWSRGGLVMVEVAKRHRDVVRSLIFEDGGIDMPVEETEETREMIASTGVLLKSLRDNISKGNVVHAAEVFVDSLNQRGHWSRLPAPVQQMILANIYTALGDTRRPLTTREEVSQFDMPVLLLTGERSPKRYSFFYNEMRKCRDFPATVVVPNAGHGIHVDNPNGFLSVVLGFLAHN
jgi:pimeloyl-ACP methyl ester carboxylesterase